MISTAGPPRGIIGQTARMNFYQVMGRLGYLNSLRLCLDAGDGVSLPASSTKWLDLSGNGEDFFRGTSASAEATDPTINGTAGNLSVNEYLSFDGGDRLVYDATNPAWMQTMHKAAAIWTICAWVYGAGATQSNSIFGNAGDNSTGNRNGLYLRASGSLGNVQLQVMRNLQNNTALNQTSTLANYGVGRWNFVSCTIDEAAFLGIWQINDQQEFFGGGYGSPVVNDAGFTMEIGARGNAFSPMDSGGRMAFVSIHTGRRLLAQEMMALFQCTRSRFGV